VDNNINSTTYLQFGTFSHRTFNARIRLLGQQ